MTQRYRWAVNSVHINNLIELAMLLTGSVQEVLSEGGMPHMDPAVKMICRQIAFAGNGDSSTIDLYEKLYLFCEARAAEGPNFENPYGGKTVIAPEQEPN